MPFAQRILSTTTLGLLLCTLAVFGMQPVQAGHSGGLHIDTASWDGTTLTATGGADKPKRGGGPVGIVDAGNAASLGLANLDNSGSWNYSGTTCAHAIYATQDGVQTGPFQVTDDCGGVVNTPPTALDNDYQATTAVTLNISAPGVLGNDADDGLLAPLTATLVDDVSNGTLNLNDDGSFDYTSNPGYVGDDSFTYVAFDGEFQSQATVTISVFDVPEPPTFAPQTDFKIMMNYELGMHCTGFEFAYCCVLPAYNSILAQVVKPNQSAAQNGGDFPMLLEGDPNVGLDALGRETVVRDKSSLDAGGNFKKYVLKYWHDAQVRNDGRGKVQSSTLISAAEGNSLMSWNTTFNSASVVNGSLQYGDYNGSQGVLKGDNTTDGPADNYQNAVWNHLYFYGNNGGPPLEGENPTGDSLEKDKIRLGVTGQPIMDVVFPEDCGPALQPLGPVTSGGQSIEGDKDSELLVDNTCGGFSNGNVLTFSGDKGTVVYTQMKLLENLPIMLTSPDIWESLGLPLTPFEDSVNFFYDPGKLDEDSVRPFVAMKAQMFDYDPTYDPTDPTGAGGATMDSQGKPVIGFGTAPIDIPNCERCHSNPPNGTLIPNSEEESDYPGQMLTVVNSPNAAGSQQWIDTQVEYEYWMSVYPGMQTGSDWYARLKSAAISMLTAHDDQHGTSFTAAYPGAEVQGVAPQNTRLNHESVICQRCHADNVIAAVKSAECGADNANPDLAKEPCAVGTLIKPITEAIHNNHRGISMKDANGEGGIITFTDLHGRDGGCQGCHPAHRSDGDMFGYPITLAGGNKYWDGDNRGANGGCFVGRDVHSNPGKDNDGVETPEHLNAAGQYLANNVANDGLGIWCTNCHSQLGQEIWKAENMKSLVHGVGTANPRGEPTLAALAIAVGTTETQAISWLDPKDSPDRPLGDDSYAIWAEDPGLCDYVSGYLGATTKNPAQDGNVATLEVSIGGGTCSNKNDANADTRFVDCGFAAFDICGSKDGDGDFSVNLTAGVIDGEAQSPFCTTPDCVVAAQATLNSGCGPASGDRCAVPVPMSAATDGRDHWLAPGEPHCADCHAAPFVEQSGNINPYPPFNYPRKASLMRYSKGHQNISCQGCHESIHGLYPVTPNIDTTTYAQAAALNHDGSHGPLKCGTCHEVNSNGIPTWMSGVKYNGIRIRDYDDAVSWMHTFTDEVSPLEAGGVCQNCHGDRSSKMAENKGKWLRHSFVGRVGRSIQDKAEIKKFGHVAGGDFVDADNLNGLASTVCTACHSLQGGPSGAFVTLATCDNATWKSHNVDGRLAEKVWEYVSDKVNGDGDPDTPANTCGW